MSRALLFGLTVAMLVLSACHGDALPPAPPVTHADFVVIRNQYQRARPEVRVGLVTAVLPSSNLASVGEIPVKDFVIGDVISFLDSNQKLATMGTVESIGKATLVVKYAPPEKGGREPLVNDLAVRAFH